MWEPLFPVILTTEREGREGKGGVEKRKEKRGRDVKGKERDWHGRERGGMGKGKGRPP